MATPEFVLALREHVGHDPLWLPGVTVVVCAHCPSGEDTGTGSTGTGHGLQSQQISTPVTHVLLVQSPSGRWKHVTGIVDPGEDPHVAAIREVAEETTVDVAVTGIVWVQALRDITFPNGDRCDFMDVAVRADLAGCGDAAGTLPEPEPADGENLAARWWPVDRLPEMDPRFRFLIDRVLKGEPVGWGPIPGAGEEP